MTAFVQSSFVGECETRSISIGCRSVGQHSFSAFTMSLVSTTIGFYSCFLLCSVESLWPSFIQKSKRSVEALAGFQLTGAHGEVVSMLELYRLKLHDVLSHGSLCKCRKGFGYQNMKTPIIPTD